jgi:hypothetical protein
VSFISHRPFSRLSGSRVEQEAERTSHESSLVWLLVVALFSVLTGAIAFGVYKSFAASAEVITKAPTAEHG